MVVAQKLKEAEITEQDSLLLTRNLLRIAIFNISYIRGLFPEKYFTDKSVPALEMKIKKLMPMDAESRRLIDWMEKGVYDALQKKYLKTLLFCICETLEGPTIEEYAFSFSYSDSDSQEVRMNINRSGTKKGGAFKCDTEITPNEMRSSACKLVRTLVQLMRTLDKMPEERTILMKLLYFDDVTPAEYEPPFFRGCIGEEAHNTWTKNPLKMEVGNVNSKHFVLALKVKSVLDPCEDENDDSQDDTVSLGSDTVRRDEYSDSDSEVNQSADGEFIVAPIEKQQQPQDDNCMVDEDDTQDPLEDEHQLARVKNWISSHHLSSFGLSDVLSNFIDISAGLTEEIMNKLVEEGVISKTGKDIYHINNQKTSEYDFSNVKEEMDCQAIPQGGKAPYVDDNMYMKAVYHTLPMNYVSASKLQIKLNGEANTSTVRKLIERMVYDGLLESKGSRRLGKRVLHSDLSEKMLAEAKRVLDPERMDIDVNQPQEKSFTPQLNQKGGSNQPDMSTCGGLHSIGSDLTRTGVKMNDATQSNQSFSKTRENNGTPISRAKTTMHPVASRESFIPGNDNGGTTVDGEEVDAVICSKSTQKKRPRKTSTVKEPILQHSKRQKSAL